MSNCDTQLGWFYMAFGPDREVLCHRCHKCASFTMCGDGPARAFCCGKWKTPPKESLWAGKLPRIVAEQPRGMVTLPGTVVNFTK